MEIPKPAEGDKEYFRSLIPEDPRVDIKPMFGNVGAFVNGNMFAGLFGSAVGVKLSDADRVKLLAIDGSGPFGPSERPMGGYVSMPDVWRDEPKTAKKWVAKALDHNGALPPKAAKAAKKKAR